MSRPKCPNHVVEMDPTDEPRIWICPVSTARFECDVDIQEGERKMKKDKFGKLVPDTEWKITPGDGTVNG